MMKINSDSFTHSVTVAPLQVSDALTVLQNSGLLFHLNNMIGVIAFSVHILKLQLVLCFTKSRCARVDEIVHCFKNVCVVRMSSGKVHRQLVRQVITSTANR